MGKVRYGCLGGNSAVKWKRARGKAEKNKMIKRCSGCLAVRYHDRTCQNAYVIFIQRIYSLLNPCRRDGSAIETVAS